MKIFMVRHGEAADDLEDAYGGAADFELTDVGRAQARDVADRLRHENVQAVYSSPLRRAREAAQIIAATLTPRTTPIVVAELHERNSYGVLSGLEKKKAAELFGYLLDQLKEKPGYSREPLLGAEDFDAFILRVRRAFEAVVADAVAAERERIVVVTHGKFTQGLFEEVLNIKKDVYLDLAAINPIEYTPAVAKLDAPPDSTASA